MIAGGDVLGSITTALTGTWSRSPVMSVQSAPLFVVNHTALVVGVPRLSRPYPMAISVGSVGWIATAVTGRAGAPVAMGALQIGAADSASAVARSVPSPIPSQRTFGSLGAIARARGFGPDDVKIGA